MKTYKALCILLLFVTPCCAFMNNDNNIAITTGDQNNSWMIGWRAYIDPANQAEDGYIDSSYTDFVGNITAVNGNFIKVEFDTQRYLGRDHWWSFQYTMLKRPYTGFMWVPASWFNDRRATIQ